MKIKFYFLTVVLMLVLQSSCKKEKFNERRLDGTWKLETFTGYAKIYSTNPIFYEYNLSFADTTFKRTVLYSTTSFTSFFSNEISFDKKNNKVTSTINRKSKVKSIRIFDLIFRDSACLDTIKDVINQFDHAQTIVMEGEYTLMDKNEDFSTKERMQINYTRYGIMESITNEVNLQNNINIENFYQYYNGYCLTKSEYKNLRPVSVSLIYKDMTRDIIDILEMKESTKDKLTFYTNSLNLITEEYNLVYTSNKEENGTFTYKKE
jgi:hypothetical protein